MNEGRPDTRCGQVFDAVLDACLEEDLMSKGGCETAPEDNMVMVVGEITTKTELDYEKVVRGVVAQIGFDISDAVLDAGLKEDPMRKVGCETASKDNMVMVVGEITTKTELDYEKVVRGVLAQIGFDLSDAVLDACLKEDPMSKVGCGTASKITWSWSLARLSPRPSWTMRRLSEASCLKSDSTNPMQY